jgi:hypothetical protein
MNYDVGLIIDGLILVFLAVTIFYAARLTLFMKSFRESREALQFLIRDLTNIIQKSEMAISTMKREATEIETETVEVLKEAKFIADELKFMNSAGDNLAERLGKLADRNKELVDLMVKSGGIGHMTFEGEPIAKPQKVRKKTVQEKPFEIDDFDFDENLDEDDERDFQALEDGAYSEAKAPSIDTQSQSKVRSFAIFDKEFVLNENLEEQDDIELDDKNFRSKAEQDLYEALKRKKRVSENS